MKKYLFYYLLVMLVFPLFTKAQKTADYKPIENKNKYFIGLVYGQGNANWKSKITNTDLYDPNGKIVSQGDFSFVANNQTTLKGFEVSVPVSFFRLGMGMVFETYSLDKLKLSTAGGTLYPFNESFQMDKMTAIVEFPLPILTKSHFTFDVNSRLGYFGFTHVNSINLFGGPFVPKSFFASVGGKIEYEVYKRTYLFVNPYFERKHFITSKIELPSKIEHTIYTSAVLVGLRINVYK